MTPRNVRSAPHWPVSRWCQVRLRSPRPPTPTGPITLIVPWGACGGTDAVERVERILATLLEETWVIRSRDSWPRATPAGLDDDQGRNPNPAGSGPPADRSSCCSAWTAALPSTTALFGGLVMLVAGVAAFFMERWGFPLAPTILGVVLGTMLEEHFFSSLVTADGNFLVFVGRPIAGVLGVDPAHVAVAGGPHA